MAYKFVGNGAGIPGLPHVISQTDIDLFNEEQTRLWQAALSSGAYQETEEKSVLEEKPARSRKPKTPEPGEGE